MQLSSSVVRRVVEWIVLKSLEVKLMSGWLTHAMKWNMTLQNITQRNKTIIWYHMDLCAWYFSSQVWCPEYFLCQFNSFFGYIEYSNSNIKDFHGKNKTVLTNLTSGFLLTTRCSPISRFLGWDCISILVVTRFLRKQSKKGLTRFIKAFGRNGWNGDISFAGKMDSFGGKHWLKSTCRVNQRHWFWSWPTHDFWFIFAVVNFETS